MVMSGPDDNGEFSAVSYCRVRIVGILSGFVLERPRCWEVWEMLKAELNGVETWGSICIV